jgi:hypothetical protein
MVDGVALWLDAAMGVDVDDQGRIGQWLDRSPYQHVAQAVGEATDWPLSKSVGGYKAVGFGVVEGASTTRHFLIADDPSLQFGTDDFAIIAVLQHRTPTVASDPEMEHGVIYAKTCDCANYVGPALFANDLWPYHVSGANARSAFAFMVAARTDYSAQTASEGFNDNKRHIVLARRIHDVLAIEVDGMPQATALTSSTLDVSTAGVPVTIGAHGVVDLQALEGEIFELIAVRGTDVLHTPERVGCLLKKYDIR